MKCFLILPVVMYGCETWSVTLSNEHSLMVFENKVLRKVFGPKRDEGTGEWRKLHNEELIDLYQLLFGEQIKKNEMGGICSMCGEQEKGLQGYRGET